MEFIEIKLRIPKPTRGWLRFSLRTLLIVLTVAAIWLAFYVEPGRQLEHSVTLVQRSDNSDYGKAAYSFLDMSHDVQLHRNSVDLIHDRCGLLHIRSPGRQNRIADIGDRDPVNVTAIPKNGWKYACVKPRKGHVYILEVNDGRTQLFVKFRVRQVSNSEVELEWAFLDQANASKFDAISQPRVAAGFGGTSGTNGSCGGPHQES